MNHNCFDRDRAAEGSNEHKRQTIYGNLMGLSSPTLLILTPVLITKNLPFKESKEPSENCVQINLKD